MAVLAALQTSQKEDIREIFKALQARNEQRDEGLLQVTSNMMRTVYYEVRTNTPFLSHPKLVELQQFHGVNLGFHHYSRQSATSMMETISGEMHSALLTHLKESDTPFSIILDGSTSKNMFHYLIVLFQAMETIELLFTSTN